MDREHVVLDFAEALERIRRRMGWQWGPVTRAQYILLSRLRPGPAAVGELAEKLHMSTAAITRMLDKLEEGGLIERRKNPQDLRQVYAVITPEGLSAWEGAHEHYLRIVTTMTHPLPTEHLALMAKTLSQITAVAVKESP